jgi:type IX secretion system PorP/SprF family membrane protein
MFRINHHRINVISKTHSMAGVRLSLLSLCLIFASKPLFAQQLSLFTQYRENLSLINPAAIETDYLAFGNNVSFGASYRAQWIGLPGNPRTQTIRGTFLADQMSGVALMAGGQLINDQTGPTGFTGFYGRIAGVLTDDPAYGGLSVGLSAGLIQYRVDAGKVILREPNDILGTQNQSQLFPDVGIGVFMYKAVGGRYGAENYIYGGVSVPQVVGLDLTFQNDQGEFFTKRIQHFYGQLGFFKFFRDDSFLEPSLWVKYVPNAPANIDVNLRYQLPAPLWIGAGGSSAGTVHLETGLNLGSDLGLDSNLRLGYGFDYSFSNFGPFAGNTHEINLSISFQR